MADDNTHINYSLEDIERYLKGMMSSKEMHDLERAALQDSFLADAIEGFSNSSFEESRKHLNGITAALQREKEETKVVPLRSKSFYWFRAAAVVIIITGVGVISWYFFGSNNTVNKNDIALIRENKAKAPDTVANTELKNEPTKSDSAEKLLAQNGTSRSLQKQKKKNDHIRKDEEATVYALKKSQPSLQRKPNAITDSFIAKDEDAASANISSLSAPLLHDTLRLQETSAVAKNAQELLFKNSKNFIGRVTDHNNKPVAFATVEASNSTVFTDANGYFTLQAPDSLLNVTVSSEGFASTNAQLKSNTTNNISIQPGKTALPEVATGLVAKNRANKSFADSVYPLGGWKLFQEYVYKKSGMSVDTLNDQAVINNIQIEFLIGENGVPYDFTVLKSSGDETASKVIEIIKEGPRWITTSTNKKGRITIRF